MTTALWTIGFRPFLLPGARCGSALDVFDCSIIGVGNARTRTRTILASLASLAYCGIGLLVRK